MQASKTPTPPPKLGRVATIGYTQPGAWQIVTHMAQEQGWHLVDIRYDRNPYCAPWTVRALRQQFGYRYHAVPELVNLHELEPGRPIELVDPASGRAKVSAWVNAGLSCLLVCQCPDWQQCHRKQVKTLLRHANPALEVAHLVCDRVAIQLPVVLSQTVELFQWYGLLRLLPHAPGEQPVLLRTAKSQRIMLPDYGPCLMSLSVTLWLADPQQHQEQGGAALRPWGDDETTVDAVARERSGDDASGQDAYRLPQQRSQQGARQRSPLKESMVYA